MWVFRFFTGILKGRFRVRGRRSCGSPHQNSLCDSSGCSNNRCPIRIDRNVVHKHDELPKSNLKFRILKPLISEKGDGELLAALMVILVLTFMLMQPIDTNVFQNKNNASRMILNKYMNKMRLEGYLKATDEASMIQDFNNIGCPVSDPSSDIVANAKESRGDARVLRNSDPNASALSLTITCTPTPQPFKMMSLIGRGQTSTQITVGRKDLSERVDP